MNKCILNYIFIILWMDAEKNNLVCFSNHPVDTNEFVHWNATNAVFVKLVHIDLYIFLPHRTRRSAYFAIVGFI